MSEIKNIMFLMPRSKDLEKQILLTPKDVETLYRIPTTTLATLRSRGGGPSFIKRSKEIIYKKDDIEFWLDSMTVKSTSDYQIRKNNDKGMWGIQ